MSKKSIHMRRTMPLSIICMASLVIAQFSYSQDVAGTWSGTISMEINQTNILGTYHLLVSLSIVDNQVKGTTTSEKKVMVEGKQVGDEICSGGIGPGILWRVAFSDDGTTYDIEATAPNFECTSKSFLTGHTETGPQDGHHIVALENRLIGNKNLLSGSKTETSDMDGLGTSTTTVRWSLSRTSGIDLIIIPADYDNWLPVPGKDELTKGSVMGITLKLLNANGTTPSIKAKKFELKLSETSREPGITINAPHQPLYPNMPDLRFVLQSNATMDVEYQTMEINCNSCLTTTVQLAAYDGGGWTTLTAKAILEDDSEVEGKLLSNTGPAEVPIPKRDPNSHIGLKWLNSHGNPADEEGDDETSKGNKNNGDGLTVYEEYRGVFAEGGKHKRLDPQKKELGVWTKKSEITQFEKGFDLFTTASEISVIKFIDNDIAPDRKLNKNFLTAHVYEQSVLRMEKGPLRDEVGLILPKPGIPGTITKIIMDVDKFIRIHNSLKARSVTVPFTLTEDIANTVAHEIGHGVNIEHHGSSIDWKLYKNGIPTSLIGNCIVYDKNNNPINLKPRRIPPPIGFRNNAASGNTDCIMSYIHSYAYCLNDYGGKCTVRPVPRVSMGKIFCKDIWGTDINDNHEFFDDAMEGEANCLSQIKLK